jgi:cation:H+ antiporter
VSAIAAKQAGYGRSSNRPARANSLRHVLPQAQPTDIYLTGLGIVLTVVYGWGLITRPNRQVLLMGMDSLTVLLLCAAGIAGLIAVTND